MDDMRGEQRDHMRRNTSPPVRKAATLPDYQRLIADAIDTCEAALARGRVTNDAGLLRQVAALAREIGRLARALDAYEAAPAHAAWAARRALDDVRQYIGRRRGPLWPSE